MQVGVGVEKVGFAYSFFSSEKKKNPELTISQVSLAS